MAEDIQNQTGETQEPTQGADGSDGQQKPKNASPLEVLLTEGLAYTSERLSSDDQIAAAAAEFSDEIYAVTGVMKTPRLDTLRSLSSDPENMERISSVYPDQNVNDVRLAVARKLIGQILLDLLENIVDEFTVEMDPRTPGVQEKLNELSAILSNLNKQPNRTKRFGLEEAVRAVREKANEFYKINQPLGLALFASVSGIGQGLSRRANIREGNGYRDEMGQIVTPEFRFPLENVRYPFKIVGIKAGSINGYKGEEHIYRTNVVVIEVQGKIEHDEWPAEFLQTAKQIYLFTPRIYYARKRRGQLGGIKRRMSRILREIGPAKYFANPAKFVHRLVLVDEQTTSSMSDRIPLNGKVVWPIPGEVDLFEIPLGPEELTQMLTVHENRNDLFSIVNGRLMRGKGRIIKS